MKFPWFAAAQVISISPRISSVQASAFFSSPVSNGKTIYIVSRSGSLISLAPGDEFKQLGSFDLGDQAFATPAIAGGSMYVRTFSKLYCFGPAKTAPAKKG